MNRTINPNSLKNLRPPWRPGESGNPTGIRKRPYTDRLAEKAEERLPEELRAKFNAAFERQFGKAEMLPPTATYADAEVLRLHLNTILKGDVASASFISDRIEGKPPNRLDLIGNERRQISIRVVTEERPPLRGSCLEAAVFRNVAELIERSNNSEDDAEFLIKAKELAKLIRERALKKGRMLDGSVAR